MVCRKKIMRVFFVFAACMLYIPVFFSCKPQAEVPYDVYNTRTLRTSALQAAENIDWVFDKETDRKNAESGLRFVRLTAGNADNTAALFLADISVSDPIYPEAEGFTSLDTRMIPKEAYGLCQNLIEGCVKKELNIAFFASECRFLKPLYEYELKLLPDVQDGIVGKARIDEKGIIEVPLRLRTSADSRTGFLYLSVFLVRENNADASSEAAFKVEQIVFEESKK
ncbi:hypothetical protein V1L52_05990 [Treponema sp. HNW]|uniref:hypothetical protein n=1 Tax=Treponema sp. HNW TaxID=3116654 RepID=UPI003D107E7E